MYQRETSSALVRRSSAVACYSPGEDDCSGTRSESCLPRSYRSIKTSYRLYIVCRRYTTIAPSGWCKTRALQRAERARSVFPFHPNRIRPWQNLGWLSLSLRRYTHARTHIAVYTAPVNHSSCDTFIPYTYITRATVSVGTFIPNEKNRKHRKIGRFHRHTNARTSLSAYHIIKYI